MLGDESRDMAARFIGAWNADGSAVVDICFCSWGRSPACKKRIAGRVAPSERW
jgi:hypothetical protein